MNIYQDKLTENEKDTAQEIPKGNIVGYFKDNDEEENHYLVIKNDNNEYLFHKYEPNDYTIDVKDAKQEKFDKEFTLCYNDDRQTHKLNDIQPPENKSDATYILDNKHQYTIINNISELGEKIENFFKGTTITLNETTINSQPQLDITEFGKFKHKICRRDNTTGELDYDKSGLYKPFGDLKNEEKYIDYLNEKDKKNLNDYTAKLNETFYKTFLSLTDEEINNAIQDAKDDNEELSHLKSYIQEKTFKQDNKTEDLYKKYTELFNKLINIKKHITTIEGKILLELPAEELKHRRTDAKDKKTIFDNHDGYASQAIFKAIKNNTKQIQAIFEDLADNSKKDSVTLDVGQFHKIIFDKTNQQITFCISHKDHSVKQTINLSNIDKNQTYNDTTVSLYGASMKIQNLPKNIGIGADHGGIFVYDHQTKEKLFFPINSNTRNNIIKIDDQWKNIEDILKKDDEEQTKTNKNIKHSFVKDLYRKLSTIENNIAHNKGNLNGKEACEQYLQALQSVCDNYNNVSNHSTRIIQDTKPNPSTKTFHSKNKNRIKIRNNEVVCKEDVTEDVQQINNNSTNSIENLNKDVIKKWSSKIIIWFDSIYLSNTYPSKQWPSLPLQ